MVQLAEMVQNVPRPVVSRLLYASYIIHYGYKPVKVADTEKMTQIIRTVFNSKNASGAEDGLYLRVKLFDISKYALTDMVLSALKELMDEKDLKKINFKSIHDYLPLF